MHVTVMPVSAYMALAFVFGFIPNKLMMMLSFRHCLIRKLFYLAFYTLRLALQKNYLTLTFKSTNSSLSRTMRHYPEFGKNSLHWVMAYFCKCFIV